MVHPLLTTQSRCGFFLTASGCLTPLCRVLSSFQESVMLQFCGNKLDKKDFFGKSDPFLVFYRSNEDGS